MSQNQKATVHNHTELPARPDLIRLIIGIFGIGSSGPLIALSTMPVPTLIFWRNLGGSLMTLPFALRHKMHRIGVKWAILAGAVLAVHFVGFFISMRMTSVTAGTAIVATQPIFAAFFVKLTGGHIPAKAWFGMLISFTGVLLVTGIDLHLDRRSFLGDMAALISGALAAAYMLIDRVRNRLLLRPLIQQSAISSVLSLLFRWRSFLVARLFISLLANGGYWVA